MSTKLNLPSAKDLLEAERLRPVYDTGSFTFNLAVGKTDPETGEMGIPAGTMCEYFGPNQTFKTGSMEQVILSIQRRNKSMRSFLIFTEEPNFERMEALGLDLDRIHPWVFHPNYEDGLIKVETALNLSLDLINTNKDFQFIGIDSLKASVPIGELQGKKINSIKDLEDNTMALRAKLYNKYVYSFSNLNASNAILFMTNQISEQIGPCFDIGSSFKTKTSCGRGKEHMSYLRVNTESTLITDEENKHPIFNKAMATGLKVFYELEKNKFSKESGHRRAISEFSFTEKRFLREKEVLTWSEYLGLVVRKKAGWWDIEGNSIQGEEAAQRFIYEHKEIQEKLETKIKSRSEEIFRSEKKKSKESILEGSENKG